MGSAPPPPSGPRVVSPDSPSGGRPAAGLPPDILDATLLGEAEHFRPQLTSDDPLPSELRAAQLLAGYTSPGGIGVPAFLDKVLELAREHPERHVAAMVAAVGSLLPGQFTAAVVTDMVRSGVLMPRWYRRLGLAKPDRAWRCRDVFGDQEIVLVTYAYGTVQHGIVVETVQCPTPRVLAVQVTTVPERTLASLRESTDATGVRRALTEISLEEARGAVSMAIRKPYRDAEAGDLVLLPIVRNRVARLPEPVPPWAEPERGDADVQRPAVPGVWWVTPTRTTAEQRAAAVDAFLADTELPPGVDRTVLRFWAEALVGYTGLTVAAPTRIGPAWLAHALTDHVPAVFELTGAQRAGLLPAVTAWTVWAATQQDLPRPAVELLVRQVAELDAGFDDVYADPGLLPFRCYLSDVAARTADGEELLRVQRLRTLAAPPPYRRGEDTRNLLASDPDQRRQIHAARLRTSPAPEGVSPQQWLDAVALVSDRLWNEELPDFTAIVAARLDRLEALDKHDHIIDFESVEASPELLDRLALLALEHPDTAGFVAAAENHDWACVQDTEG